ncbi:shikimate kinase [Bacteroidota bacterium]
MKFIHDIYAVAGKPILHSKSPYIFQNLFNDSNLFDSYYIRIAADSAKEVINIMKNLDIKGINITSPFKQEIIQYLDELDEHAKKIKAVNTVINKDGSLKGHNTDFIGVIESLKKDNKKLINKKCLVIGAGGAGRAAAYGLVNENADVTIINRTDDKALQASKDFNCNYGEWDKLKNEIQNADICVNSIPHKFLDIDSLFMKEQIVLSADYSSVCLNTLFNNIGGYHWLLNQAYSSFKLFTGISPLRDQSWTQTFTNPNKIKTVKKESRQNISLIGFIGSGKTVVGRALAHKLNWNFVDTDELIVEKEGIPIREIFKVKGESYFRKLETGILLSLKNDKKNVISTGGGMILDEHNRKVLKEISNIFWLFAPIDICFKRLKDVLRPPLTNPFENIENAEERAEILFSFRIPYYCEIADALIYNNNSIEKAVGKIYEEVHTKINN